MALNPKVLILDDERTVRETLGRFLKLYGYEAIPVDSVDEAVQRLRTTPVQAVILDVRLPDNRSGLEVLAPLRAQPALAGIPVLILTGALLSDEEELLITRLRAHLFHKPEGFDTLIRFLDQLTGRDQAH